MAGNLQFERKGEEMVDGDGKEEGPPVFGEDSSRNFQETNFGKNALSIVKIISCLFLLISLSFSN